VQSRAQCNAEENAEQQAEGTSQQEQVQPLHPDKIADSTTPEPEVISMDVSEMQADEREEEKEGEDMVAIPSMEEGSSLRSEFREEVVEDETLSEWRIRGKERKHGYLWDHGVVKKMVKYDIRGN